jgi:DNA-binding transcriptional LysR family regulator
MDIVKRNAGLTLSLSFADRIIDPIEEGVDLAIRFGETRNTSDLISRKLAEQKAVIVASPEYLRRRGVPVEIEDIYSHECIVGFRRDIPNTWRVRATDGSILRIAPPAAHEFGDGAAIVDAAVAGLGLAQMPHSLVANHIATGRLRSVLDDFTGVEVGLFAVWPADRHLLPRVRHVVSRLVEEGKSGGLDDAPSL